MNDQEFLTAFEQHTLSEFPHKSHIRMAWLYLRSDGWEAGQERIQRGIQNFAAALGATNKYHQTITLFWARLVQHAIDDKPEIDGFDTFIEHYPFLLNKNAISAHYSTSLVQSEAARRHWIEPDLLPMPRSVALSR
jgi:hypothetical protein